MGIAELLHSPLGDGLNQPVRLAQIVLERDWLLSSEGPGTLAGLAWFKECSRLDEEDRLRQGQAKAEVQYTFGSGVEGDLDWIQTLTFANDLPNLGAGRLQSQATLL